MYSAFSTLFFFSYGEDMVGWFLKIEWKVINLSNPSFPSKINLQGNHILGYDLKINNITVLKIEPIWQRNHTKFWFENTKLQNLIFLKYRDHSDYLWKGKLLVIVMQLQSRLQNLVYN